MSKTLRTPLGQVRGLGASKEGVGHFIQQRASAILLVFLMPWLLFHLICIGTCNVSAATRFAAAQTFLATPWNAILTVIAIGAALFHMRLGVQVVIEDYIHKHGTKLVLLLANTFAAIVLFAITVYAVFSAAV